MAHLSEDLGSFLFSHSVSLQPVGQRKGEEGEVKGGKEMEGGRGEGRQRDGRRER